MSVWTITEDDNTIETQWPAMATRCDTRSLRSYQLSYHEDEEDGQKNGGFDNDVGDDSDDDGNNNNDNNNPSLESTNETSVYGRFQSLLHVFGKSRSCRISIEVGFCLLLLVMIVVFFTDVYARQNRQIQHEELISKIENMSDRCGVRAQYQGSVSDMSLKGNNEMENSKTSEEDTTSTSKQNRVDVLRDKSSVLLIDIRNMLQNLNSSLFNYFTETGSLRMTSDIRQVGFDIQLLTQEIQSKDESEITILCSEDNGCQKTLKYRCFKAVKHPKLSWAGAREWCREMGGKLAEITDNPTMQYLRTVVNPKDGLFWLGASGIDSNGKWAWWNLKQKQFWTDTKEELCLGIWEDGWWFEDKCTNRHSFICQRDGEINDGWKGWI